MYRIGIIGSENSHALGIAKSINLPDPETGKMKHPQLRVVGILGDTQAENQKLIDEGGVEFIADTAEVFFGKVDAMIVDYRKGSRHAAAIMPFVEAGLPCFVDKPFTIDMAQAYALVDAAAKSGAPIMGGSSCKLSGDVEAMAKLAADKTATGELLGAYMSFTADTNSKYDGLYFYGIHLVEMAMTVFGYDPISVIATQRDGVVSAILRYQNVDISLQFTRGTYTCTCSLIGSEACHYKEIDLGDGMENEISQFEQMLLTGKSPYGTEKLVVPVAVVSAIVEALETGREVQVAKFLRK